MTRKVDETTNFLALYEYHTGNTEVPVDFHRWSAVSLIAACLGNNVWIEKFRGDKLFPNLYVMLLGASSSGKGIAIGKATKFVQDEKAIVNSYRVSGTKQGSIDLMGMPKRNPDPWYHGSRIYMIAPELVNNVGSGPLADDWVRWMTDMYTIDEPYVETTRTHGIKLLPDPMINWLAGSTEEWMRKSISQDAITGGFFARTIVVPGEIDYNYRVHKPTVPHDYEQVRDYLKAKIWYMCRCKGQMVLSPEAEAIDESWYMNRPPPTDESSSAMWGREHDIKLKVAMIVAISDMVFWPEPIYDFTIKAKHIQAAQKMVDHIRRDIDDIIKLNAESRESIYYEIVTKYIKEAKQGIAHGSLLKKIYPKGIGAGLLANLIATMVEAGTVEIDFRGERKAKYYMWRKKRLG